MRDFARVLGAGMCATRRVTDQGWMPRQLQVGLRASRSIRDCTSRSECAARRTIWSESSAPSRRRDQQRCRGADFRTRYNRPGGRLGNPCARPRRCIPSEVDNLSATRSSPFPPATDRHCVMESSLCELSGRFVPRRTPSQRRAERDSCKRATNILILDSPVTFNSRKAPQARGFRPSFQRMLNRRPVGGEADLNHRDPLFRE